MTGGRGSSPSPHHCTFCGVRFQPSDVVIEYELRSDDVLRYRLRYHCALASCLAAAKTAEEGGFTIYFVANPQD